MSFSHPIIFSSSHSLFFTSTNMIFTSSHPHFFAPTHIILTSSHALFFTSTNYFSGHGFSSSHLRIRSAHLHICAYHLLIYRLHIFTSAHIIFSFIIFTSSHRHISSSHLTSSHLSPFLPLSLPYISSNLISVTLHLYAFARSRAIRRLVDTRGCLPANLWIVESKPRWFWLLVASWLHDGDLPQDVPCRV